MALDLAEVRRIATLAGLELTAEEEALLPGQLRDIVDYLGQLREIDAAGPEAAPTTPPVPEADDEPRPCLPREVFEANAPRSSAGFLTVPRIKPA